ncbi:MAG TPA: TonB-dependent receptor plug domain-containing protein [Polyangiaceae bacterium]|nr:TonB-dependent receptor plug domain-containing protein [Polyangiaceae bacterium]
MPIRASLDAFLVAALISLTPALATAQDKSGLVAPTALSELRAPYPDGASGDADVILELLIAEDGSVASSSVKSGDAPFAEAARLASESFRFTPALRGGIPVRARIAVRLVFHEPKPEPADSKLAQAEVKPNAEVKPDAAVKPDASKGNAPDEFPARNGSSPSKLANPAGTNPPSGAAPAQIDARSQEPSSAEAGDSEIVVLGEQRPELGSIHIPKQEARRVPGAFGDPFRVVEVLPGVAPVLSGLPYFYVRGAPPGSVGYSIDGVPVPMLFHVGPGPSVIAPMFVERVDLYPGAYPAKYGRSAGALLAGETALPSERQRVEGQARIFDASAAFEQPFAKGRGNLALGGRYSYMQALLSLVAPDYELGYWDYQARASYALTPRDRVTAFGFAGVDKLRNEKRRLTLFDVAFQRLDVRWDHQYTRGRVRVGVTGSSDRVLAAPEDDGAPGTSQRSRGLRLRSEWEHDLGPAARLRAGADIGFERVLGEREQVGDEYVAYPNRTDRASGAYADVLLRPLRGVEIVPGLRVDAIRSRGEEHLFVDPRLSVRARLKQGVAYLAGFGLAHQVPTSAVRMPGRRPNALERSVQESIQATQGLEYTLPWGMLGRTTLFHQYVNIDTEGVHGRSYGVEQFLRRDFTQALGGFISYTLARAEGTDGRNTLLSGFDRTHVLSGVLGYDFGAGFRFGARAYYASGRPYRVACPTIDCGPGDPRDPPVIIRSRRMPGFFRLDLRFEKRFEFEHGFWLTATAEWFNATLSREVEDVDYTSRGLYFDRQSALTLPSIGLEFGY